MEKIKIGKKKAGIVLIAIVIVSAIAISISTNVIADEWGNPEEFVSEVIVELNATDDWSGVAETWYCYEIEYNGMYSAVTWTKYTEPLVLSALGNYTFSFYSIDNEGNIEDTKTSHFSIIWDTVAPITTIKITGDTEY